ncbi:Origin recognition complex, subunit 1 [Apophysomyces sp. BC1034]|nr:Origin recognition complex, subunit 1 [Apophysomyces sp. BC1021]KAG0189390.1 Origin recognition complex, subunit 1 [Apophysomyces sp. BC1034]
MPRKPLAAAGKRSAARVNYAEDSSDDEAKKPAKRMTRRSTRRGKDKDEAEFDKDNEDEASSSDHAEEEEVLPKPRSKLLASLPSRRTARPAPPTKAVSKKPSISSRSVHRVNIHQPIIPLRRMQQERTTAASPYELARERLHVSAVPESLPCREDEFTEIMGYLESAIEEGTGMCVYISGVPGTGKTATVLEIIRHLQYQAEQQTLPAFDFVEINGMKLTDPNQAYSVLWECLDRANHTETDKRKRVTSAHALQLLEAQFNTNNDDQKTTVVLMDELDLLVTKKQTVMYNFFEWPNRPFSKLIVVAVANTMDLPERMLSNKISSRMGLTRINFQPYTHQQLYQIVESRLHGIDAFEKEAVEFAARKVSAVSGDARRALDICRRAVEIVEARLSRDSTDKAPRHVTIGIINEAIREMFSSPSVAFIQSCSLHQKLFLVSVMLRARRAGVAEVEFGDAALIHMQACKWHLIEPPTTSDLMRVCESLGQTRALVVENGRMDLGMRITLNLVEEDIKMACKADKVVGKLLADT